MAKIVLTVASLEIVTTEDYLLSTYLMAGAGVLLNQNLDVLHNVQHRVYVRC